MSEITDKERIEWVKKHSELQKAFETAKDYLGQMSVGEYVRRARHTIDTVILAEKTLPKSPVKTKAMTSKRDMLTVKGVDGRSFNVRLILKGDTYGRSAVHNKDEPMLEFYDASQDPKKFGPYGQVVSQYYVSTIQQSRGGLDLLTYVAAWKIPAGEMDKVRAVVAGL
jgi:hypothetical protein